MLQIKKFWQFPRTAKKFVATDFFCAYNPFDFKLLKDVTHSINYVSFVYDVKKSSSEIKSFPERRNLLGLISV